MSTVMADDKIKEKIVSLANEHWQQKTILLLAQVGQVLNREGINLKEVLRGRRLSAFIGAEMHDSLEIVPSPTDPLVQAVKPKDGTFDGPIADYFGRHGKSAGSPAAVHRFNRSLWLAFSRAIQSGNKRIVLIDTEVTFQDVKDDAPEQPGFVLTQADIVLPDGLQKDQRDLLIAEKIVGWATLNSIPINSLHEQAREKHERVTHAPYTTLLTLLIDCLEPEELRRINMPLDIISKLHRKIA